MSWTEKLGNGVLVKLIGIFAWEVVGGGTWGPLGTWGVLGGYTWIVGIQGAYGKA